MNILLAAYACEPNNGSEPEVGWQMVLQIAKKMPNDNIYIITKKNNREIIEKEGYPTNMYFYYYELPKWLSFYKKGQRGVRTYYYIWMIAAALYMKKKNISFDIVQHITFVNDWLPSFWMLLKNKNTKFIWGPIGSNDPISSKFLDGFKRNLIENIRMFLQKIFRNLDPFFHIAKYRADCIIGINEEVKTKLNLNDSHYFIAEPAIAMKKSFIDIVDNIEKKSDIFTILSVGRLMYIKNFKMTILAFSEFIKNNPGVKAQLKILGKGEDKNILLDLVKKLDIEKYVVFAGQIPLDDVFQEFSNADLFLFPSLENAGFVFLEAMTFSLPIIGLNYGGAPQFVKSNVDLQLVNEELEYNEIVSSLSKNINNFYYNKEMSIKVGKQNKDDLIKYFTWEAKAEKMKKIYKKLIDA